MLTKLPIIYDLYNHLAKCLNRFLIVKAVVSAFNNKKALVEAFSGHCATSQRFIDSSTDLVPQFAAGEPECCPGGGVAEGPALPGEGHSTVQYSTVQCSTVQYSTVKCSTVQYSCHHTDTLLQ